MFYKVLDNVISERYSKFLFDQVVKLPWTFVPNLSYSNKTETDNCGFSFNYFLGEQFQSEGKLISTPEFNYIIPLLMESFDKFGIDIGIEKVFRSRARLTTPKSEVIIEDKHVDYKIPHLVLLYYINTTDGDTILFDGDKIIDRISPRRRRCVLFDGSIVHASSSSTLSPRVVLNNNILI
jgi:hypothetical protein